MRTSGVLNLLEALAQSRAVFELDALLIRGDGIVPAVGTMKSSSLACITLGPLRVYPDTLREMIGKSGTGKSWRTNFFCVLQGGAPFFLSCVRCTPVGIEDVV